MDIVTNTSVLIAVILNEPEKRRLFCSQGRSILTKQGVA